MSNIMQALHQEAHRLAWSDAHNLGAQDQFAQLYLDSAQGSLFRELCLAVRQSRVGERGCREAVATIFRPADELPPID